MGVPRASSAEGAVQQVIGALTADIAEGRLPPGARLTEAALATRFGLSRGPVREALRHLAVQGLLAHRRHAGAEVRRLTRAELRALFDLREVTEGLAARLAAAHATAPPAAARLRAALDRLAEAAAAGDIAAFGAANAAFHAEIVALAANPYVTESVARLRLGGMRAQFALLEEPGAITASQAAHLLIGEALAAGDGLGAEAAMRAHLRAAAARLLAQPDQVFG
jgi:DNA-binding GntR family transcriptional regulator